MIGALNNETLTVILWLVSLGLGLSIAIGITAHMSISIYESFRKVGNERVKLLEERIDYLYERIEKLARTK